MEPSEHIVILAHALIGRLGCEPDAKVAVMTWRELLPGPSLEELDDDAPGHGRIGPEADHNRRPTTAIL
jgi:hypothetical protein